MINILRQPDDIKITAGKEKGIVDAKVWLEPEDRKLKIYLTAQNDKPEFICMRWNHRIHKNTRIMGDKWERAYADLSWSSLNGELFMPWYFMASDENETVGCGVMVRPNSFVSFQCDSRGVTAWFDVRCGASGVELNGRVLEVATIVCECYSGVSPFEATKEFCKVMCADPILPKEPVYGSNNWYYAYGKSSREEILKDASILAELTSGNENRPFMVIDDCWTPNRVGGPWVPNERFGDMKQIADEFKKMGVRPGIWARLLHDVDMEEKHPEWRIKNNNNCDNASLWYLDPSHPEVKDYLRDVLCRIKGWGYELLKHDFSSYDMFGAFGSGLNGMIANYGEWSFYEKNKTSAEIVLDFYRLIRECTDGMLIIGCSTFSHLSAGLVQIHRSGDDTSGKNWSRTRALGVNTLAFRIPQNGTFYMVDADCVGILDNNIDWKLNKQWLELLSKSGTPLFISAQPSSLTEEMKEDIRKAYKINSVQRDVAQPIDWLYNNEPEKWLINGEEKEFDWVMDSYPALLYKTIQPY